MEWVLVARRFGPGLVCALLKCLRGVPVDGCQRLAGGFGGCMIAAGRQTMACGTGSTGLDFGDKTDEGS